MFSRPGYRKIERITLSRAVRDAVIGKYLVPGAAINTNVRPFDAPGSFLDVKGYSDPITGDLRRACGSDDGRGVINIHRLADPLA